MEGEKKNFYKGSLYCFIGNDFLTIKQVSNFIFSSSSHSRGLAHSDHSTNADKSLLKYMKLKKYVGDWG